MIFINVPVGYLNLYGNNRVWGGDSRVWGQKSERQFDGFFTTFPIPHSKDRCISNVFHGAFPHKRRRSSNRGGEGSDSLLPLLSAGILPIQPFSSNTSCTPSGILASTVKIFFSRIARSTVPSLSSGTLLLPPRCILSTFSASARPVHFVFQ